MRHSAIVLPQSWAHFPTAVVLALYSNSSGQPRTSSAGLWAHLCKDGALIHLRTPAPCIKCAFSKSFHDLTYCGMNQLLDKHLAKPWAQVERPIMDVIQKHVGMGVGWRMGWVFGISRGKPLYTEQINPKILLYSTGNYFLYTMVNYSLNFARKTYKQYNKISLRYWREISSSVAC